MALRQPIRSTPIVASSDSRRSEPSASSPEKGHNYFRNRWPPGTAREMAIPEAYAQKNTIDRLGLARPAQDREALSQGTARV